MSMRWVCSWLRVVSLGMNCSMSICARIGCEPSSISSNVGARAHSPAAHQLLVMVARSVSKSTHDIHFRYLLNNYPLYLGDNWFKYWRNFTTEVCKTNTFLRLPSTLLGELERKLTIPLLNTGNVTVQRTLSDEFHDVFVQTINENPTYSDPSVSFTRFLLHCVALEGHSIFSDKLIKIISL